jgi:hypothetical protein
MKNILKAGLSGFFFLMLLVSCGGGGGSTAQTQPGQTGQLSVFLTDSASCGIDHVFVNILKVRVHKSSAAENGDGGWTTIIPPDAPVKVDLLTLQNGLIEDLGIAPLAPGHYTQIRLYLAKTGNAVDVNGVVSPIKVPSGFQSGIKIIHDFDIKPGQTEEIVLDFDPCRSVVSAGKKFILKPVIKAVLKSVSGAIAGAVDQLSSGAVVKAEINGHVFKQTHIRQDGSFLLSPLPNSDEVKILFPADPTGTFDVVIVSETTSTVVTTGVPVTTGQVTVISTTTSPTHLPFSAIGVLEGHLNPTSADARVKQMINGDSYQIDRRSPDLADGSFAFILPTGAPRFGTFSMTLPISYSDDTAQASEYTVDTPNDNGLYNVSTKSVTVSSSSLTTVEFTGPDALQPKSGTAGTVSGAVNVTGLPPTGFGTVILSAQMNNEDVNTTGVPFSSTGALAYAIDDLAPGTYSLTVLSADELNQASPDIAVVIPSTGGVFTGNDFTVSP